MDAQLVLADGRAFSGRGLGSRQLTVGEVVFNTSMTGYQEILTDPSYRGQIVCMTQPLMGNYGVNPSDVESRGGEIHVAGFVAREIASHYSNPRATNSLPAYLREHAVTGIDGIDTRALTRHLRDRGAMVGAVAPADHSMTEIRTAIEEWGAMDGRELVSEVTTRERYRISADGAERFVLAAYDYGAKQSIFRRFSALGARVEVFPAGAPPGELLAVEPDGVVLSNGPGDPAACGEAVASVRALLGQRPLFGICLGHQLLGLALGAHTYKLPFGHHGGNHPVQDLSNGAIDITAQNHGFAVDEASLVAAGALVTHVNLNDRSVEGFSVPAARASAVQYHPEAAPGPHDARGLFQRFLRVVERR